MKKLFLAASAFILLSVLAWTDTRVITSHAISLLGKPKYEEGFKHFAYVNQNAPKGGTLRLSDIGSFDSFHTWASRGVWPAGTDMLYDSLMVDSFDELDVLYGLIAEKIEYPEDYTWIIFHLNPRARFQDGSPITAEDVAATVNRFLNEGVSHWRQRYANVQEVTVLDRRRVQCTLKEGDKQMLMGLASLPIMPKKYWESRDFTEPLTEVPLGSGPYTITDYDMGQYVVYERIKDYWAADLPVNKGQNNFDVIRYDYYRDDTVAFEAFKSGEYDFHRESIAKNWANLYTGRAFDAGHIVKEWIPHEIPPAMVGLVFNTQRPFFQDRLVRLALTQMFDFEWMNKNLFYGQYTRTRSFFQNTEYEAKGLPGRDELEILEPLRGRVPPEVFTQEYNPPKTDGSGNIRPQMRRALDLLKQAGWEVRDRKLVNVRTGEPMEFELLLYTPSYEPVATTFQKSLERLGIAMDVRLIDLTQYTNRIREKDYDLAVSYFGPFAFPQPGILYSFHSDFIEDTWNTAMVQDQAVDALLEGIVANQGDKKALLAYGPALDRVLTWNHYLIPFWNLSAFRVAYWDKFSRPEVRPKYALGLGTWWVDPRKEARLPDR